ncbi:MAG: hypothetical protein ACFCU3_02165 [Verrucomicrobiales bacterium]
MKILYLIFPIFVVCGGLTARGEWKLTEHERHAILLYERDSEGATPSVEGLEEVLAQRDESLPLKHVTFWTYFNSDPTVQGELVREFESRFPGILAEAFKSSGNKHNPKVLPLEAKFSECLLQTPTVAKINDVLFAHGYSVARVEFEKLSIDTDNPATPFRAALWLILEAEPSRAEARWIHGR